MRSLFYSDVSAAARVLLVTPPAFRGQVCMRMIREAEFADRFVRRIGKLHPKWGNGTLLAVARRRRLGPEPGFDDPEYSACFQYVLAALHGASPLSFVSLADISTSEMPTITGLRFETPV
ncbi:MAG: hypothetical protein WA782_11990 [Sulfitobacter sp.]